MANNQLAQDLRRLLLGMSKVAKAHAAIQKASGAAILENSSVLKLHQNIPQILEQTIPKDPANMLERASMVGHGVQQFASVAAKNLYKRVPSATAAQEAEQESASKASSQRAENEEEVLFIREEDLEGLYVKSLGVEVLQQNEDGKRYEKGDNKSSANADQDQLENNQSNEDVCHPESAHVYTTHTHTSQHSPNETSSEPKQQQKSSKEVHDAIILDALKEQLAESEKPKSPNDTVITHTTSSSTTTSTKRRPSQQYEITHVLSGVKPLSTRKPLSQLSETSKERKVPASRIGRLVSYGGLAAGLGFGAISEMTKRSLGLKKPADGTSILDTSPFLSEANAERIVDTLCRVRGAALKIGQILSIQDNSTINPQLQKVFERVRHSADFMPPWQMEKMLETELGSDWRSKLLEFDDKPFAAASIGQVHLGKLLDSRPVAIKIQYPGVAKGIESDIDNLVSILGVWNILPEGVFVDSLITVAKRELSWEVNYLREAECAKRFRQLLAPFPDYYIPEVIDELTTKQIYTTELIEGIPVDKCDTLDQETRDRISFLLLDLFFRELFEFRFMQTDPNWSNFLYNLETKQVGLLDFGASREYSKEFVDKYAMILKGAAENDRQLVLDYSRKIGFLTGYESKAMENAHVDTVMLLGEAFRIGDEAYDFGSQDLTMRIQKLVPIMVQERLCPPPEEVYSLHRKLSGMFLLCSKLKGRVRCRPIFDRVWSEYQSQNKKD